MSAEFDQHMILTSIDAKDAPAQEVNASGLVGQELSPITSEVVSHDVLLEQYRAGQIDRRALIRGLGALAAPALAAAVAPQTLIAASLHIADEGNNRNQDGQHQKKQTIASRSQVEGSGNSGGNGGEYANLDAHRGGNGYPNEADAFSGGNGMLGNEQTLYHNTQSQQNIGHSFFSKSGEYTPHNTGDFSRQMTLFEAEWYGGNASHFFRDYYRGMFELAIVNERGGFDASGVTDTYQFVRQLQFPRPEVLQSLERTAERSAALHGSFRGDV